MTDEAIPRALSEYRRGIAAIMQDKEDLQRERGIDDDTINYMRERAAIECAIYHVGARLGRMPTADDMIDAMRLWCYDAPSADAN